MPLPGTALHIHGHAIVSADGKIAAADGTMPPQMRVDADWRAFQKALDESVLVVLGREGHERHPNPGRSRLVLTSRVDRLEPDPADPRALFYNPAALPVPSLFVELGLVAGTVAVTGGTRVFDLFRPWYDQFILAEVRMLVLPEGRPTFSADHPRFVLPGIGLSPTDMETIAPGVVRTHWVKTDTPVRAGMC